MGVGQLGETDLSVLLTNSSSNAALVKAFALSKASCFCLANPEAGMALKSLFDEEFNVMALIAQEFEEVALTIEELKAIFSNSGPPSEER